MAASRPLTPLILRHADFRRQIRDLYENRDSDEKTDHGDCENAVSPQRSLSITSLPETATPVILSTSQINNSDIELITVI